MRDPERRFRNDNWGDRARIGIFIVGIEAVPEAEWYAMAPPGVSIHAVRVVAPTPWAAWRPDRSGVELSSDLQRGCTQFAAMRLSAVVVGHTSSSVAGGEGWDDAVIAAIRTEIGQAPAVTTNGFDTAAALEEVGSRQPFMVFPPWYGEATVLDAVGYYSKLGFNAAGHMRYAPGGDWAEIPPSQLYANGMAVAQEIEPLFDQIVGNCPASADCVLIPGTGFRCAGIIDALEGALGRPVVTANQASLWRCLRLSGVADRIEGYGALFSR